MNKTKSEHAPVYTAVKKQNEKIAHLNNLNNLNNLNTVSNSQNVQNCNLVPAKRKEFDYNRLLTTKSLQNLKEARTNRVTQIHIQNTQKSNMNNTNNMNNANQNDQDLSPEKVEKEYINKVYNFGKSY